MFDLHLYRFADCPPEVFSFRYKVYVEELNRRQSYADHEARTIIDPMDASAHHGVAYKDGEIAAVIRMNFVRDGGVDPYYSFYEIDKLPADFQSRVSISTRNMVAKEYRKTPLAFRMLKLMYELSMTHDAIAGYIDINAPLQPMFEKVGFKPLFEKEHPDYGLVTVMRIDGYDIEHFEKVRSPFAPLCRRFIEQKKPESVE